MRRTYIGIKHPTMDSPATNLGNIYIEMFPERYRCDRFPNRFFTQADMDHDVALGYLEPYLIKTSGHEVIIKST